MRSLHLTKIAGLQDGSDATIETLKTIEHPISKQAQILVDVCSFAGTGNVLKVQTMLHHCDEHIVQKSEDEEKKDDKDGENKEAPAENKDKEPEKKVDDTFQAFAVLGTVVVAMGEEIGAEMCLRQLNHLASFSRLS
jgi:26S proteasome regulatory subunit N1